MTKKCDKCGLSREDHDDPAEFAARELPPSKEKVDAAFNRACNVLGELFAGKQAIKEVAPQTLGCERYRLVFSGARFSEVNEAMHDLGVAIRQSTAHEPQPAASKDLVATWIAREIGDRCPERSPSCLLCLIWKYFDQTQQWPAPEPRTYADTAGTYSSHEPQPNASKERMTLGQLVLETARGSAKERVLTQEEAHQIHEALALRATHEPPAVPTSREAFQEWARSQGPYNFRLSDQPFRTYHHELTEHAWRGWANGLAKAGATQPPASEPPAVPNPYEDRARAWDAVARKLEEINPHTFEAHKAGLQCALDEIERLQDRSIVASRFVERCLEAVGRNPNVDSANLFQLADQIVGCIEQYKHEAERAAQPPASETCPLRSVVQAVVDWNTKYPSSRIYDEGSIRKIAAEMDAIFEQARAALAVSAPPPLLAQQLYDYVGECLRCDMTPERWKVFRHFLRFFPQPEPTGPSEAASHPTKGAGQ